MFCEDEARQWLGRCIRGEHPHCTPVQLERPTPLPRRILQIQGKPSATDDEIKLLNRQDAGGHGYYAALSYRWGKDQEFKTTTNNIGRMMEGISLNDLPKTIEDAVDVARGLGLRYLWVDVLCIAQDSAEDRAAEISRMADVYNNALVVISAVRASDCRQGFLDPVDQSASTMDATTSRPITYRTTTDRVGSVMLRKLHVLSGRTQPVDRRCWTFQESILARRILSFGNKMTWACKSGVDLRYGAVTLATSHEKAAMTKYIMSLNDEGIDQIWQFYWESRLADLYSIPKGAKFYLVALLFQKHAPIILALYRTHKADLHHILRILVPFAKDCFSALQDMQQENELIEFMLSALGEMGVPVDSTTFSLVYGIETVIRELKQATSEPSLELWDHNDPRANLQLPLPPVWLQTLAKTLLDRHKPSAHPANGILPTSQDILLDINTYTDLVDWIRECSKVFTTARLHSEPVWDDILSAFQFVLQNYEMKRDVQHVSPEDWFDLIERYSTRHLTYPLDKLPALAGIAARASRATGDRYVAGHWRSYLLRGLLWRNGLKWSTKPHWRKYKAQAFTPSSSEYIAPSWSWDSSASYVIFQRHVVDEAELLGVEARTIFAANPSGQVAGGMIAIRAPVKTVPLSTLVAYLTRDNISIYPDMDRCLMQGLEALFSSDPLSYGRYPMEDYVTLLHLSRDKEYPHGGTGGLILHECRSGVYERVGLYYREDTSVGRVIFDSIFPFLASPFARRSFSIQTVVII